MEFDVQTEGLNELVRNLVEMATGFRKIVVRYIGNLGEFAKFLCKMELEDLHYTGDLERSFVVEVNDAQMEARVYPTAKHRMFVRMGTRPHWAPIGPLKRWAAAKLGDENLAYPVQWSIARYGTSVYQLRKRGTKANPWPQRVVMRADFQQALRKTAESIGGEIVTEIVQ